ncbi:hypothetical protein AX17_000445 [Amanita inopinata Kibby_2008]|nr:hypothetical protein AX17_000445 [Amanita inopinata Kibby_2008]
MTSAPSPFTTRTSKRGPLHFLAHVALDVESHPYESNNRPGQHSAAGPSYETPPYTVTTSPNRNISSLHISCRRSPSDAGSEPKPLIQSTTTNSIQRAESVPTQSRHPMKTRKKKCHTKDSSQHVRAKEEMLSRRRERLERATKIRSLDNSPVNDEQLTVLRMVYDEITMYPSESWMVLIAIIIRRSFKQVKNWFSNERQKNRTGEMISVYTEEGDKMRLRLSAFKFSEHWSDSLLEEIAMVYHYMVIQTHRRKKYRLAEQRESSSVLDLDGPNSHRLD